MAKYGAAGRSPDPRNPRKIEEEENRLEEELLIQEQLESLAWPIWNDIETRIAHAIQAYNAGAAPQTKLHVARPQEPYQMLVHREDATQALSIKLDALTGMIVFGKPAGEREDRLIVKIEGKSSYRIERYPSAEAINPGELARIILDRFLNPGSSSAEQVPEP
jgi:hypothetical protein